ncbi:putative sugar O-methyltransferase [Pseudomonas marginalis]|jgi:putative sugar O-methyltransferase|uniref:putative sugar O-methyltransferase n=1 Tax=Pseudomonas marginalis TaxID=298 RepID=UPI002480F65B|nr:putative sugar O-methyltransferase [Pseudomonas marginalis]WGT26096.1 putative sugar O-methyltransferase [Pseudomonas marginalis]
MRILGSVFRRAFKFLAKKPETLFKIQQGWLKFGYAYLDLTAASWVIRRPEWLMVKSQAKVTKLEPELPAETHPNTDIAVRIIKRYQALNAVAGSFQELIPEKSMWGVLRLEHYRELCQLVESGDVELLARRYTKIFRTDAVNGYSYGTTFNSEPFRWAYLPIGIELSVVTLAEHIGILRAETHEQGKIAYWRLVFTEEQLMDRIEEHFGFRVEAPRFGDPRGIMFGGRFLSRETCSHLYTALRMREIIDRQGVVEPLRIVEIGGGYGGTCYWLRKLMGTRIARYAIVDLPEVSLVQSYFLGSAVAESLVLDGESISGVASPIQLVPHFELEKIDFQPNILINQDSMPEMPESEVDRYLSWGSRSLKGLFISFNQEAYSPWAGTLQVHVPTMAARYPHYRRVSRETSWDRRGYVEEAYVVNDLGMHRVLGAAAVDASDF